MKKSLLCFLCLFWTIDFAICQILVPLKAALADCATGIETFDKVAGVDLPPDERIPLYSSSTGDITPSCYNRCRSSSSCTAFWIDYTSNSCFRVNSKFGESGLKVDFTKASAYFERQCLQGEICSKAWVTERVPGYELSGHDDVIIRSVSTRKRCSELCLTDKRLPCRSADYWESKKECRLSRESRRTQPGSFVEASSEVEYIENTCIDPVTPKERNCDWEVMRGFEFPIGDFLTKSTSLEDCQKSCEAYSAFTCRSITFDTIDYRCFLSGSDMSTTSAKLLRSRDNKIYSQRVPCIDMSLTCNGESMLARLKTHSPFYGKLYSSALSSECEAFGHGKLITTLEYPLNSCGIFKDADGSFIGNMIVQQHPLIQKRGDAAFRLVCTFPQTNLTLTHSLGFENNKESESRLVEASAVAPILGIATSVINSTAKAPNIILRIIDKNGHDVSGVSLGDELYLKIEVDSTSAYGIFARDLIAKSGTNEEELVLLDSRGCPEDIAIFPHLKRSTDGSKSLQGRFEAFKFTNDAIVRFQVYLQFCRSECPPIKCDGESSHGRRRRAQKNYKDVVELKKEIIVRTTPHMPTNKDRTDETLESVYHRDNDMHICGPKNLVIAVIIGFCVLQVVIVFCCTICVCQRRKEKHLLEPSFRSTADLYYGRPSIFNTIRSLRS